MQRAKAVIWYAIDPALMSPIVTNKIRSRRDVRPFRTHKPVAVIDVRGSTLLAMAEDAFAQMQGENWSPRGEARPLLTALDLTHTSMSIGDVVVIEEAMLIVDMIGFRRLD